MKDYVIEIQLFDLIEKFKPCLNEIQTKQFEEILELYEKKIKFELTEEIKTNTEKELLTEYANGYEDGHEDGRKYEVEQQKK